MTDLDENFFTRADEHIDLSNRQLSNATMGKVSASMMYSVARFNAWVSACAWTSGKEMAEAKEETIGYFVEEYKAMLMENLQVYIENFDDLMKKKMPRTQAQPAIIDRAADRRANQVKLFPFFSCNILQIKPAASARSPVHRSPV